MPTHKNSSTDSELQPEYHRYHCPDNFLHRYHSSNTHARHHGQLFSNTNSHSSIDTDLHI